MFDKSKNTLLLYILKAIFILLLLFIFFMLWRIFEKINSKQNIKETTLNSWDAFCILDLNEVSPIAIKWTIKSWDIRVIAWNEVISWNNSSFTLSTKDIYKSIQFVIPSWVWYFASKRWKKVYKISDIDTLEKMSASNIIFFNTLKDANDAWFEL